MRKAIVPFFFAVAFLVGIGIARADFVLTKLTTPITDPHATGGSYPVDHSQPGTGTNITSNSLDGSTSTLNCGTMVAQCYHCTGYINGVCEWACNGMLTCNDGYSQIMQSRTCIALMGCQTPGF